MKWVVLSGAFCLFTLSLYAQHQVVITVTGIPESKRVEHIFLAGSLNNWNPADSNYKLNNTGHGYTLTLPSVPPGPLSFKFTRGSWETVEIASGGQDIPNRFVELDSDTMVSFVVEAWRDEIPVAPRKNTASPQVKVLTDSIWLPALNRKQAIRIYLPEGYAQSKKRYPVLYMQDGKNLFNEADASLGEWGIDECLDSLIRNGQPPCIVVGIDQGENRISDYLPVYHEKFGEGKGMLYLSSVVHHIKAFIDKRYRTMPSAENTCIAGSSLGGLISYYAILHYPGVFGNAGIFSPSFWIAPEVKVLTDSIGNRFSGKCFFYIGDLEGKRYKDDMISVADHLGEHSSAVIYSVTDPQGRHNEIYWRKWFPEFYIWIMGNGFNRQIKTKH